MSLEDELREEQRVVHIFVSSRGKHKITDVSGFSEGELETLLSLQKKLACNIKLIDVEGVTHTVRFSGNHGEDIRKNLMSSGSKNIRIHSA